MCRSLPQEEEGSHGAQGGWLSAWRRAATGPLATVWDQSCTGGDRTGCVIGPIEGYRKASPRRACPYNNVGAEADGANITSQTEASHRPEGTGMRLEG